ncbi:MAG TPA: mandelate racemase/muconate lactonizing enzyme family protein [Nitrospiraceae bacterium]|jgi:L-alanine-DL-glutamate epimerase-like enolase superfamily enzyme
MRITEVRSHLVDLGVTMQYRADVAPVQLQCLLVRIVSDEGLEGFSQPLSLGSGASLAHGVAGLARATVVGEDPRYPERIWQKLWAANRIGTISNLVHSAIDIAVWDLAGKIAGLPLYMMLGAYRDSVRAYASTPTLADTDAYINLCQQLVKDGFRAIKLHGWGEPERDIEACEAVRHAVGPKIALMLDVVGAYDRASALRVGRELDRLHFEWFEEPILDHDLAGYRDLCNSLDIPIAGGEVLGGGIYDYATLLSMQALDIVRPSASLIRGITPMRKAAAMAEAFNVRCEPNSYGTPLTLAANLHVICTIKNCDYLEIPVPRGALETLAVGALPLTAEGDVQAPQKPGLGVDIDVEDLERRTVAVV